MRTKLHIKHCYRWGCYQIHHLQLSQTAHQLDWILVVLFSTLCQQIMILNNKQLAIPCLYVQEQVYLVEQSCQYGVKLVEKMLEIEKKANNVSFHLVATLVDASPKGQFAGQVVALAYDNAKSETRIGDFTDAGGDCQGRMTCWVPTNMTAPRALYTNYASTTETTTVSTKSVSTILSSRAIATKDATTTTTLTQFSTLTSFNIPSLTVRVPVTTTETLEFIYEKHSTIVTHSPTTFVTSITVSATSLTVTTTTTVVPTTTITDTTTETSFTYTLNETTTTSTTYISTSVSNTYTLTTISIKTWYHI